MINKILKPFGIQYKNRVLYKIKKRTFSGASTNRLYSAWTTTNQSADAELRNSLSALRARARELERNNDYAKKFIRMVKTNVIGKNGIRLQSQIVNDAGKPDPLARKKIEEAFKEWSKKGNCDVTGKYSFRDIQKLVIGTIARDGEIIVRKVKGFNNDFKFALQLIEADHLDEKYNDSMPGGNQIKMGVEYDKWGKATAYHIFKNHPGDAMFGQSYSGRTEIPANEIEHLYLPYRVSQGRGLPWMHSALTRLNMLGNYEESELVAARVGASKGGFYEMEGSGEYTGDDTVDDQPVTELEPGTFEVLPQGMKFKEYDPTHPTTAFSDFSKSIIRGISSGLDVSYNYLSNDLEGVNYSSIRAGVLDERDVWRDIQAFMSEHFLQPIFEEWLEVALLTKQVFLPMSKFDKFSKVKWQPRGWEWVDPLKDAKANQEAIKANLKTASQSAGEQGNDLDEVYATLAIEKEKRKKLGLATPQDLEEAEAKTLHKEVKNSKPNE